MDHQRGEIIVSLKTGDIGEIVDVLPLDPGETEPTLSVRFMEAGLELTVPSKIRLANSEEYLRYSTPFQWPTIAPRQRVKATGEEGTVVSMSIPTVKSEDRQTYVTLRLDLGAKRTYALDELEPCE